MVIVRYKSGTEAKGQTVLSEVGLGGGGGRDKREKDRKSKAASDELHASVRYGESDIAWMKERLMEVNKI